MNKALYLSLQPALFENIVNEAIQHLHEVIVQNKSGEPEVGYSVSRFIETQIVEVVTMIWDRSYIETISILMFKVAFIGVYSSWPLPWIFQIYNTYFSKDEMKYLVQIYKYNWKKYTFKFACNHI